MKLQNYSNCSYYCSIINKTYPKTLFKCLQKANSSFFDINLSNKKNAYHVSSKHFLLMGTLVLYDLNIKKALKRGPLFWHRRVSQSLLSQHPIQAGFRSLLIHFQSTCLRNSRRYYKCLGPCTQQRDSKKVLELLASAWPGSGM